MKNFIACLAFCVIGLVGGLSIARVIAQDGNTAQPEPKESPKKDPAVEEQERLKTKARKLMEISQTKKMMDAALRQGLEVMKDIPGPLAGFSEEFLKRAKVDDLIELILPVYIKHYDEKTIDTAIEFYSSETGKIFAEKAAIVTQETMEIGKKWGAKLGEEVAKDLLKKNK